jgi:hypothetical protein
MPWLAELAVLPNRRVVFPTCDPPIAELIQTLYVASWTPTRKPVMTKASRPTCQATRLVMLRRASASYGSNLICILFAG